MDGTRMWRIRLEGPRVLLLPSFLFLAAAGIASIVRAAVVFDRGIWLVAFLLLVGFVAQLLLAVGQNELAGGGVPDRVAVTEAVCWNVGAVLVPLGTLTGGKAGVILGSLALIVALMIFGRGIIGAGRHPGVLRPLYLAFVVFMAVSVATGIGLSWSQPWF